MVVLNLARCQQGNTAKSIYSPFGMICDADRVLKLFYMKWIISAVLAILVTHTTVLSQQTHFGLKAGLNAASLNVDPGQNLDSKLGLHLGGLAHIHISRHFAVQPEVLFSMQGGKSDGNDDVKLKLNYINVPVLAQYMFKDGFRIQTGPQVGFLVSSKMKINDTEFDVDDTYNGIDFSWALGAGYLFKSGFGVDARYNFGISDITDDGGSDVKNSVFQLGVFYQFMHKHK